jgi:hypothetical protein
MGGLFVVVGVMQRRAIWCRACDLVSKARSVSVEEGLDRARLPPAPATLM